MIDETVQRNLEAVIRRDGRGEVRDGDSALPMTGADDDELRALVMQHVIGLADEIGGAVGLRTVDIDGVYHLVVFPGGEIAEEGGIDPLQEGDTVLWSDGDGGADAVAGGAGTVGDLGGIADEGAEDSIDEGEYDEGEDDEGEDEAGEDEGADGGELDGDASDDDTAAAPGEEAAHADGGYAAQFGADAASGGDDADVHETIQLPRPGMMRDEPPAVTGIRPIIPPRTGGVPLFGDATPQDSLDQHDEAPEPSVPAEEPQAAPTAFDDALTAPSVATGPIAFGDDAALGGDPESAATDESWRPAFPRGRRAAADATGADGVPGHAHPGAQAHPGGQAHLGTPQAGFDRRDPNLPPSVPGSPGSGVSSGLHDHTGPTILDPSIAGGPTLGDFLSDRKATKSLPASKGWRANLRRSTGGLVTLGPGSRERAERSEIASIQRTFDGPKTIVVVNPKGGAHKTTATLMIAATLGMHRGGYTLAWDNNETRGTLGWRSRRGHHTRTAVDLLHQLSHFEISGGATIADVDRFVRNQGEAKFDVLASDDDAASAAIIDAEAFSRLHRTLSRFYRVLVIDTGNNMRASNWEAALDVADQLVIVSTAREDTAASAAWLADGLRERGHADMLSNAVTILSSPSAKEDATLTERLRQHFSQLTRAVVEVPYDEEFVGGGELDIPRLRPETRDAWRHAVSVIAQGL